MAVSKDRNSECRIIKDLLKWLMLGKLYHSMTVFMTSSTTCTGSMKDRHQRLETAKSEGAQ